jgi:hypothetical protein
MLSDVLSHAFQLPYIIIILLRRSDHLRLICPSKNGPFRLFKLVNLLHFRGGIPIVGRFTVCVCTLLRSWMFNIHCFKSKPEHGSISG